MICIKDKKACCGCTACMSICPKKCIEMKRDEEGFLYPEVNHDICVDCGLCDSVCPIRNNTQEVPFEQKGFLLQHKNDNIRSDSTAGGAFTAIAEYVLDNNGVVFGVQYDKNLNVLHTYVETKDELYKYRNSKYVQSDIGNTFRQAKAFLEEGIMVCFSGTPCQIEGLYAYLNKNYDNLILVDVMCLAVPSPLVWDKYKEHMQKKYKNITNVRFRDKYYGYQYSSLSVFTDNSKKPVYHEGIDTDFMLRAFYSGICIRPSCHDCRFKKRYRVSDFTIWDCFDMHNMCKSMDDNKGTTRVLVHTEKGMKIFNQLLDKINIFEVESDILVRNVKEMTTSLPENTKRKEFFDALNSMEFETVMKKYFSAGVKSKAEKYIRIICCKLKIYDFIKGMAKKVIKNKSRM